MQDQPIEQASATEGAPAPLVSIVVPVYNHERYIERCLRSIAMQKVTFPYEVWVGEDCSPDNSRAVLKRLESELPAGFHILYREHNMGDQGNGNSSDLFNRCQGTYMVILEGDDFWTYDGKLQAQVDFLESHPDYIACYSHVTVVGADGKPNGEKYPECRKEDYDWHEYFLLCMPGQTGTLVSRRKEYEHAKKTFLKHRLYKAYAADRRNTFMQLAYGKIHVFQEPWSAYTHVKKGGSSYSANVRKNKAFAENDLLYAKTLIAFADETQNPDAIWCAKENYYRTCFRWCHGKNKLMSLGEVVRQIMAEPARRPRLLFVWLRFYGALAFRVLRGQAINL